MRPPYSPKHPSGNGLEIAAPRPAFRRLASKACRAFTLVEVTLALGIVAMAFVPVLGLLPLGLDMSRQAIDTTVGAQIAQQLTSEVQQTDFSRLQALSTAPVSYFDDQGNRWPEAAAPAGAIYAAAFDVSTSTNLPGSITTEKLATVTIAILNTKAKRTDAKAPAQSRDSRKYVLLVPDNGR